jgi:hypothetical protein
MASTRNKNTAENYASQQNRIEYTRNNILDTNYTFNNQTFLPDFGLNPAQMPRGSIAQNSVDLESSLRGIGATNLVNPTIQAPLQSVHIPTIRFFDSNELIMPKDLAIEGNQRPLK